MLTVRTRSGRTVNVVSRGYKYIGGVDNYEALFFYTDQGEELQACMYDTYDTVLIRESNTHLLYATDEMSIITDDVFSFFNEDVENNSSIPLAVWLKDYFGETIEPDSMHMYSDGPIVTNYITPIRLFCDNEIGHILKVHAYDGNGNENDYFFFSDGKYDTGDGYVFPCSREQGNQSSYISSYRNYIEMTGEYSSIFEENSRFEQNAWVAYLIGVPLPSPLEVLGLV